MRAYVLLDPPQDYDESGAVLGVYGTYFEAVKAELRTEPKVDDRYAEIQLWEGRNLVKQWGTTRPKMKDGKIKYEWKVMQ